MCFKYVLEQLSNVIKLSNEKITKFHNLGFTLYKIVKQSVIGPGRAPLYTRNVAFRTFLALVQDSSALFVKGRVPAKQ